MITERERERKRVRTERGRERERRRVRTERERERERRDLVFIVTRECKIFWSRHFCCLPHVTYIGL